ncbi:MAG: FHA domain-containing protein [Burkholderiaceae bacterium]|jgi:predicted component of type VI protein secretion system|nr:FHA domain-containing protein [Burkholderiaceae bacterium]
MPKLILSLDGVVVKEVQISKSRSTIGRRFRNDIVIENLSVSGEHAVLEYTGSEMVLKDLGSTNGTYVNGKPIRKQALEYGDEIEIGRYKIKYVESTGHTVSGPLGTVAGDGANSTAPTVPAALSHALPTMEGDAIKGPRVRVLNGAAAGKSLALTKVVSTIGNPNVSVVSIIRRGDGYDLAHVTGDQVATVNGIRAADGSIALKHGDHIDVGTVQLEFFDH